MASLQTTPNGSDQTTSTVANGTSKQTILVEFAINFNQPEDLTKIDDALKIRGLKIATANVEGKTIQVEFKICEQNGGLMNHVQTLQDHIEGQTGFVTVINGLGQLVSAVAELSPPASPFSEDKSDVRQVFGVVRLSQLTDGSCFVDGSMDATKRVENHAPGKPSSQQSSILIAIHEYGDLSGQAYESIGRPVIQLAQRAVNMDEDDKFPTISISRIVSHCDVSSMIGKSIAITERTVLDSVHQIDVILSAGVIARASTIGFNKKKFCACSGKTLWEERTQRQQT